MKTECNFKENNKLKWNQKKRKMIKSKVSSDITKLKSFVPLGEPFIATIFAWFLFDNQVLNAYILFGGTTTLFGLFIIIKNKK